MKSWAFSATPLLLLLSLPASAQTFPNSRQFIQHFSSELSSAQVLILGEVHADAIEKANYPSLLKKLHRKFPEYNCLSIEAGEETAKIFTAFSENEKNLDQAAYALTAIEEGGDVDPDDPEFFSLRQIYQPWLVSAQLFSHWNESVILPDLNLAQQIAIDPKNTMNDEVGEKRNQSMAAQMKAHLENHSCTKIIAINGNWHLYLNKLNGSLPKYLAPYSTLNIDMTLEHLKESIGDQVYQARIEKR